MNNDITYVSYVTGNETTNGSFRYVAMLDGSSHMEKRDNGIWKETNATMIHSVDYGEDKCESISNGVDKTGGVDVNSYRVGQVLDLDDTWKDSSDDSTNRIAIGTRMLTEKRINNVNGGNASYSIGDRNPEETIQVEIWKDDGTLETVELWKDDGTFKICLDVDLTLEEANRILEENRKFANISTVVVKRERIMENFKYTGNVPCIFKDKS